jgi:exonuclease III
MDCDNFFIWNVHGLNGRARCAVVTDSVSQERASIVCLQETKLSVIDNQLIL